MLKPSKKTIYLDNAATTPIDPVVLSAMLPYLKDSYGNPSSLHKKGVEAKGALELARSSIASIINTTPREIIFTAGGTESINLAWLGTEGERRKAKGERLHFITSDIEHHAVLACADEVKRLGHEVSFVKANNDGIISLKDIQKLIKKNTALISIMYANNEIGTIQPIQQIGKWVASENIKRRDKKLPPIAFHTDASQAAGYLDLNVNKLNVDLLTITGSKIYGPKQSAILYKRSGVTLSPIIHGGGQEFDLRSGTENVAGCVGLAKALELVQKNPEKVNATTSHLRDYFINQILKEIPDTKLNGTSGDLRLPGNINILFKDREGETIIFYLDSYNIEASTGSACSTTETDPSHVLKALGLSDKDAQSSIRFSLSKHTTKAELDYTVKALKEIFTII